MKLILLGYLLVYSANLDFIRALSQKNNVNCISQGMNASQNSSRSIWKGKAENVVLRRITKMQLEENDLKEHPSDIICSNGHLAGHYVTNGGYIFELFDGSGVKAVDIEDFTHLLELIPVIKHVVSGEFLDWIEKMNHDARRDVLKAVSGIPVVGEQASDMDRFFHFYKIEDQMNQVSSTTLKLKSGEFVDYMMSPDGSSSQYSMSKSVIQRSMNEFSKKRFSEINNTQKASPSLTERSNDIWGLGNTGLPIFLDLLGGLGIEDETSIQITAAKIFVEAGNFDFSSSVVHYILHNFTDTSLNKLIRNIADIAAPVSNVDSTNLELYSSISTNGPYVDENREELDKITQILILTSAILAIVISIIGLVAGIVVTGGAAAVFIGPLISLIGVIIDLIVNFAVFFSFFKKLSGPRPAINDIEKYIRLTESERDKIYDNQRPPQYITELVYQKASNNALVVAGIKFLNDERTFSRYIFPASNTKDDSQMTTFENSEAYLNTPRANIRVPRWAPDQSAKPYCCPMQFVNQVDCIPEGTGGINPAYIEGHRCVNAIGVYDPANRISTLTLFKLGNGTDKAYGTLAEANVFLVESGVKTFVGGNGNDTFHIESDTISGILDGYSGENTIALESNNVTVPQVIIDLANGIMDFQNGYTVSLRNIQIVSGRAERPDSIIANCNTKVISGGGGDNFADSIEIPYGNGCPYDLFIEGSDNTEIRNSGRGKFIYFSPESANVRIEIDYKEETNHTIAFRYPIDNFSNIIVTSGSRVQFIAQGKTTSVNLPPLQQNEEFYPQPTVLVQDNVVIRVDKRNTINLIYNVNSSNPPQVRAAQFGKSMFLISANPQTVTGWLGNDTFVLEDTARPAELDGGQGYDQVLMNDDFFPAEVVTVNFITSRLLIGSQPIVINSIEQVTGRNNYKDHVICGCDTMVVNTQGGSTILNDIVEIPRNDLCSYDMSVLAADYLSVNNEANVGMFTYLVPSANHISFDLSFTSNISHIFLFQFAAKEVVNGHLSDDNTTVTIVTLNHQMEFPISTLGNNEEDDDASDSESIFFPAPNFVSNETALLHISYSGIFYFFFNITREEQMVEGSPFARNYFFINNDANYIIGGDDIDVFILTDDNFSGILEGGDGLDRLELDSNYKVGLRTVIELQYNVSIFNPGLIDNIEHFVGREKASETIVAGCGTLYIDGLQGFSEYDRDLIRFPPFNCVYSTTISIRNSTELDNQALNGTFAYYIEENFGHFDFVTGTSADLHHVAFFNLTQHNLTAVEFNPDDNVLTFETDWNTTLSFQISINEKNETFYPQPTLIGNDTIQYKVGEEGEVFALHNVTELSTIGFTFLRNIFIIDNGTKNVVGGDFDDLFIFNKGIVTADILGGLAFNTLSVVDNVEGSLWIESSETFTELNGTDNSIVYTDIATINGRNKTQDFITVDPNIHYVSGNGGYNSSHPDYIYVPLIPLRDYTDHRMHFLIENFTQVETAAPNGYFTYSLPYADKSFDVICQNCINATHVFAIALSIFDVQSISLNNTKSCSVSVASDKLLDNPTYSLLNSSPCTFPQLLTLDLFEVYISRIGTLKGYHLSIENETSRELIDKWLPIATNLNISLTIRKNETADDMIFISRNGFDVLHSSSSQKNFMVGNAQETVFLIHKYDIEVSQEIIIESFVNSSNLIDLQQLIRPIRQRRSSEFPPKDVYYIPKLTNVNDDMTIEIQDEDTSIPVIITLRNFRMWNENLKIVLSDTTTSLRLVNDNWALVPNIVNLNRNIIIVDENTFEENTEMQLGNNLGGKNNILSIGESLMVTNVFDNTTSPDNFFTMVFESYFTTRNTSQGRQQGAAYLPRNVHVNFGDGQQVILDNVLDLEIKDHIEALLEERVELEESVFGFVCREPGRFPDSRNCQVFHECILVGEDEFEQIKLTCPSNLVYCRDTKNCGYESNCPCA